MGARMLDSKEIHDLGEAFLEVGEACFREGAISSTRSNIKRYDSY